jgi:arginine-tRNA-protein transferase
MADMTALDYATMIEDSHVETRLVEYRPLEKNAEGERPLIAACLTDLLTDGLSMVYSFYEPTEQQRSFGTYMILDHIERARRLGLPHVYLGYWVDGSRKMAYKARFLPQERLGMNGWDRVK